MTVWLVVKGVADVAVAMHTGHAVSALPLSIQHEGVVGDLLMAVHAGVLRDAAVAGLDLDRLVVVVQSEGERVEETVVCLGDPLADRMMGKVAIVADRHVVVARLLPSVEVTLHHVAIGAGFRVVAQIARTLPVSKSKESNPAR